MGGQGAAAGPALAQSSVGVRGGMRCKGRSPAPLCPQQCPIPPRDPAWTPCSRQERASGSQNSRAPPAHGHQPVPMAQPPLGASGAEARGLCQGRGAVPEAVGSRPWAAPREQAGADRGRRCQAGQGQSHGPTATTAGRMSPSPGGMDQADPSLSLGTPAPKPLQLTWAAQAVGQPPQTGAAPREGTLLHPWPAPWHRGCRDRWGAVGSGCAGRAGGLFSAALCLVLEICLKAGLCIVLGRKGESGMAYAPNTPQLAHLRGG